jgi:hypothetical protein
MSSTTNDLDKMAKKSVSEVKKSGEDWLEYVETHPVQTMFFGLVTYFAIKGFFK